MPEPDAATTPARTPILIACCPTHGLHGERSNCFVCGGPVVQVPMVPTVTVLTPPLDPHAAAVDALQGFRGPNGFNGPERWYEDAADDRPEFTPIPGYTEDPDAPF